MTSNLRHLVCQTDRGILIVTLTDSEIQGEEIAAQLRDEMLTAFEQSPSKTVIVDFRNTHYVSSVAFWPLLSLHRKLQPTGGRLIVCGLLPSVGDVFFTTRLISPSGEFAAPFGFQPDLEAALRSIVGGSPSAPA